MPKVYNRSRAIKRRLDRHNQYENNVFNEVELENHHVNIENNVNNVNNQPHNDNQVDDQLNYLFVGNDVQFSPDDQSSDNDDESSQDSFQEVTVEQHQINDGKMWFR